MHWLPNTIHHNPSKVHDLALSVWLGPKRLIVMFWQVSEKKKTHLQLSRYDERHSRAVYSLHNWELLSGAGEPIHLECHCLAVPLNRLYI